MTVARDIANARALFEKAEREEDPGVKAHALDEALAVLGSCDPRDVTEAEAQLIANLRLSHVRRLLAQIMTLPPVSMDAWFDYADLFFGELRTEVGTLVAGDSRLRENYEKFIRLYGPDVAELLKRHHDAT